MNKQLKEALKEGDDTNLLEVLKENDELNVQKWKDVRVMLERLKELGAPANQSLEEDMPMYGGLWVLKKLEEEEEKKKRK
ncbi:hypothetical protein ACHAW6_000084 [Cyclotella cf. meneghiniana]